MTEMGCYAQRCGYYRVRKWISCATSRSEVPRKHGPNWKRIWIGGKTAEQLIAELQARYDLDSWAYNIMREEGFTTRPTREEALLAMLTPADLGYRLAPQQSDLFYGGQLEKWSRLHLDGYQLTLCPSEVGPHLRLQYDEQPRKGHALWLAMEPVADGFGTKRIFYLRRNGRRRQTCTLGALWQNRDGEEWPLNAPMVFRLTNTD